MILIMYDNNNNFLNIIGKNKGLTLVGHENILEARE